MGLEAEPNPSAQAARTQVVLIVEDEFLIRWTTAEFLRDLGYTVIEAECAADARAVLGSGQGVDLLLTDVNLPGEESGLVLAEWVGGRYPALPVVFASGKEIPPLTCAVSARRFLLKPYQLADLAIVIGSLLRPLAPLG